MIYDEATTSAKVAGGGGGAKNKRTLPLGARVLRAHREISERLIDDGYYWHRWNGSSIDRLRRVNDVFQVRIEETSYSSRFVQNHTWTNL